MLDSIYVGLTGLIGYSKDLTIIGNNAANFLAGGPGNDSLRGGGGLDKLIGGDGTDTMKGNADIDLLFMSDGTRDDCDVLLNSTGAPTGDFVNGDNTVDFSITSGRTLGTPA